MRFFSRLILFLYRQYTFFHHLCAHYNNIDYLKNCNRRFMQQAVEDVD